LKATDQEHDFQTVKRLWCHWHLIDIFVASLPGCIFLW